MLKIIEIYEFFETNSLIENGFVPEGMHPLEFAPYIDIWDTLQFPHYPEMPSYRLGLLCHVVNAHTNYETLYESGGDLLGYLNDVHTRLKGYDPNLATHPRSNLNTETGLFKFVLYNIGISVSCNLNLPGHPSISFPNIIKHCFDFDLEQLMREKGNNKDKELKSKRTAVVLTLGGFVACWFAHNPDAYKYAREANRTYNDKLRIQYSDGMLMHRIGAVKNYRTYEGYQNYKATQRERAQNSGDQRGYYARKVPRGSGYWNALTAVDFIYS